MALPKLNAPKYTMTVPSTKVTVDYRPYLVKEEKLLMMAAESKDEQAIIGAMKDLIETCTYGKVDPNKLTMYDLEYLFIKIRAKSVGESAKVKQACSSCDFKHEVTFNLDAVTVEQKDPDRGMNIELADGIGLTMCYPDVNDIADLGNGSDIDKMMGMVKASIASIYSNEEVWNVKEQSKEEVTSFIDSLTSAQFTMIRDHLENMPAATITLDYKCSSCEADNHVVLTGAQNFFS